MVANEQASMADWSELISMLERRERRQAAELASTRQQLKSAVAASGAQVDAFRAPAGK